MQYCQKKVAPIDVQLLKYVYELYLITSSPCLFYRRGINSTQTLSTILCKSFPYCITFLIRKTVNSPGAGSIRSGAM